MAPLTKISPEELRVVFPPNAIFPPKDCVVELSIKLPFILVVEFPDFVNEFE